MLKSSAESRTYSVGITRLGYHFLACANGERGGKRPAAAAREGVGIDGIVNAAASWERGGNLAAGGGGEVDGSLE